jgi:CubicO group peptidase (beta-lactamase class C family)
MRASRRWVLGAGAAAAAAALTGCREHQPATSGAGASPTAGRAGFGERLSGSAAPPSAGAPSRAAGDTPVAYAGPLATTLKRYLRPTTANPKHPSYAGAVAMVIVDGETTVHTAVGDACRYAAGPVELPAAKRVAMRPDSIFDLASLTKVYTAILAMQQVEKGRIDLAAPVVEYLPGFTGTGKEKVTVGMLLAHTGGLPVGAKVTGLPDNAARRAAVLATPLVSGAVPGRTFRYSSVGLMVIGQLVEKVTGQPLDQALRTGITKPLGLKDTGFKPLAWLSSADRARLVATDARSSRGLLRGVVHDDVANIMGGVAGHAGVFSSAADLAAVGQMLLGGGDYRGTRVLSAATVRRMLTNANPSRPAAPDSEHPTRTAAHGLGLALNQAWFMGRLSSSQTFGHTGFTGTSLVVDPNRRLVLVLLTNRAHPNWSWANPDPVRVAVANVVAGGVH